MRVDERFRDRFARFSLAVMVAIMFYLLAYAVHQEQRAVEAGKKRDAAIAALAGTQGGIVRKLTEVFTQILVLQASGNAPPEADIAKVTESLKGFVDPILIQKAVDAAKAAVAGQTGPKGDTGARGATGAPGASAVTTSTARATTTSTTRPPTTTTSSTTTTTTRRCTLNLLGIVKAGC